MKISIVLPCYQESGNIDFIYHEIDRVLTGPTNDEVEIIYIDDGSRDNTFEKIKALAVRDKRVHGIRFSRNFGHQTALLAGLKESTGDLVIMMDADGQHPPALIPEMIEQQEQGFDIVNTYRETSRGSGWFKKASSKWYYRLMNSLSDVQIEASSSDFRLMTRVCVDAFLQMDEHSRFTRGMISWLGFRQSVLVYQAPPRRAGRSGYSLRKMVRFGLDGITSFSSRPLRISFVFGLIILSLGFIYGIYAIVMHFLGSTGTGWTSLLIVILILGGVQLLSLGIVGEYISRIFTESKSRPHYFIQEKC